MDAYSFVILAIFSILTGNYESIFLLECLFCHIKLYNLCEVRIHVHHKTHKYTLSCTKMRLSTQYMSEDSDKVHVIFYILEE